MLKVYNFYKKIIIGMTKVIDVITILLMLSMVGVVFYQVIMRQVFERPPIWGEEVSVTLMIWFVFLGIVLGLEEDLHIGITMFVSKLPQKVQFLIDILVNLLIVGLSVLFIVYGYNLTSRMLGFGTRLAATGMPAATHYAVIPIAGTLMIVVLIGKIAGLFINKKEMQK